MLAYIDVYLRRAGPNDISSHEWKALSHIQELIRKYFKHDTIASNCVKPQQCMYCNSKKSKLLPQKHCNLAILAPLALSQKFSPAQQVISAKIERSQTHSHQLSSTKMLTGFLVLHATLEKQAKLFKLRKAIRYRGK